MNKSGGLRVRTGNWVDRVRAEDFCMHLYCRFDFGTIYSYKTIESK